LALAELPIHLHLHDAVTTRTRSGGGAAGETEATMIGTPGWRQPAGNDRDATRCGGRRHEAPGQAADVVTYSHSASN